MREAITWIDLDGSLEQPASFGFGSGIAQWQCNAA